MFWGLRLAIHIALRHKGEDARYVEMRKIWASCPAFARALIVYFNVFGFQGTICCIYQTATWVTFWYAGKDDTVGAFEIAGILVWITGLSIELIGDR